MTLNKCIWQFGSGSEKSDVRDPQTTSAEELELATQLAAITMIAGWIGWPQVMCRNERDKSLCLNNV